MAKKTSHSVGLAKTPEYWSAIQKVPEKCSPGGSRLRYLHEVGRYRVDGLKTGAGERPMEYRIRCKYGEVYPVGSKTWAWCGESVRMANKISSLLGDDAVGPFGGPAVIGEESVIWFKESRVEEVLAVAKAYRRRKPGVANNLRKGAA